MTKTPHTVTARRAVIAEIISSHTVTSQKQLSELLSDRGYSITQATLSRDLESIGAHKVSDRDDATNPTALRQALSRYIIANDTNTSLPAPGADIALSKAIAELLLSAESAGVMIVLRTPPGAAQFLAGHIDRAQLFDALGTVAGDDTIFIVARSGSLAREICIKLLTLAERGSQAHV